jgi:replicative DNA helicase
VTTPRKLRSASLSPADARVPPHNLEAEESVLGACLMARTAIATAVELVRPEDFYKPAHGEMFEIMLDLYARGEPVDAIILGEELRRRGQLEDFGGKPYLFTLVNSVPTPGSVQHYAEIVVENATLRRIIEAGQQMQDIGYSLPDDVPEAVNEVEGLVYDLAQRRISNELTHLKDLLIAGMNQLEEIQSRGTGITGVATGFHDLDDLTAGLQPSNLIIVAARPSMGKSALALAIAQHAATVEHVPVLVFTLEMSKMELVQRLMCMDAKVDSNRMRRGTLSDSDWPRLSLSLGRLAEAPIYIDDTPSINIMEMRAKCRRVASKSGLGLVIVDYLQLMAPTRQTENRVQEVSEISRALKILAKELNVPVIALSQLSRNVEYRADKRPLLADLRESGAIEQDADLVMFIYRDEVYNTETPQRGIAEIHLSKHRSGPIGKVELTFLEHYTKFTNLARGL